MTRERLVDDQDAAVFEVDWCEVSTARYRRAEGRKKAVGNVDERARSQAGRRSTDERVDLDLILELVLHRKPVGERDALDTGLRAEPTFELFDARASAG